MKVDEAIKVLENGEWWDDYSFSRPETDEADKAKDRLLDAIDVAVAALRAQQEQTENDPLTLDDLKEMDGQPVWAEEPDGYKQYSRWVLVCRPWKINDTIYLQSWPGQVLLKTFLDGGGKIYRRPPGKEAGGHA